MTNSSHPAHLESAHYLSYSLTAERMLWQENNIAMGYSPKADERSNVSSALGAMWLDYGAIAIPLQGAGQVLPENQSVGN
jgi:hypothetical protein